MKKVSFIDIALEEIEVVNKFFTYSFAIFFGLLFSPIGYISLALKNKK